MARGNNSRTAKTLLKKRNRRRTLEVRSAVFMEKVAAGTNYTPVNGVDARTDDFLRSYEWRKLRMEALKLHGARCQCCGASPATGAVMNVDHIKPRRLFPNLALTLENLQVLCHECNHGKGNWDQTDWRPREGYFYNTNSRRDLAHIWTGTDTACRMWSSGGIGSRSGWSVHAESAGKRICHQCSMASRAALEAEDPDVMKMLREIARGS